MKIRKILDILALTVVMLIAVDRHYPTVMCALGVGIGKQPGERNVGADIVSAARSQIGVTLRYAPEYERIEYPNGDVPKCRGVCTDVVIRALRDSRGVDLQSLIYKDMKWHRWAYPLKSILQKVDSSIVHRRVLNMECYFRRHGWMVKSINTADFLPGDIVTCRIFGLTPHVMIVSDRVDAKGVPLVIHNVGRGTREEAHLFTSPIEGHFRCP